MSLNNNIQTPSSGSNYATHIFLCFGKDPEGVDG